MLQSRAHIIYQQYQLILALPPQEVDNLGRHHPIPKFSEANIQLLCKEFCELMNDTPAVVELESKDLIVIGDIRGNLHALILMFSLFGLPPFKHYIFLGDLVDGGFYSLEVMTLLLALKCIFPDFITLLRGSCEHFPCQTTRSLQDEIFTTYKSKRLFPDFTEAFSFLPISALLDNGLYLTHMFSVKAFKNVNELVQMRLPIPVVPLETNNDKSREFNGEIDEKAYTLFNEENGFSGIVCGGIRHRFDGIFINNEQTQFFISLSEPSRNGAILQINCDEIEPVKYTNPPMIPRNMAAFADLERKRKSCVTIKKLIGGRSNRIKPQVGIWNFGDFPQINPMFSTV